MKVWGIERKTYGVKMDVWICRKLVVGIMDEGRERV